MSSVSPAHWFTFDVNEREFAMLEDMYRNLPHNYYAVVTDNVTYKKIVCGYQSIRLCNKSEAIALELEINKLGNTPRLKEIGNFLFYESESDI